ncbi:MAG: LPS assembly protein LptD [Acidobacteriota bacterium]|nr:LPS assembly protein LptD [Acidobacteriota bacterium]
MRADVPRKTKSRSGTLTAFCVAALLLLAAHARAQQQTNPVERKVENPITDTPSVNPLNEERPVVRPRRRLTGSLGAGEQPADTIDIHAERNEVTGPKNAQVIVYQGNVDIRAGIYRLQADKVTDYEAKNLVVAEGNVVFDQGEFQRITGSRAEWNYATKTGFFLNSTGFTNQTQDGTIIYFTADRVEKVSGTKIVVINGEVTACGDDEVPKWSFKTARATITLADHVRLRRPAFLVKHIPVFWLPYASVSIKPRDRASGFLTPTFSGSGQKGFRVSGGYFQTLGRSADITFRTDIYTMRGYGFGADLRTRANSRSYLNLGFYAVKDRVLGPKADAQHPDQGGSSFYIDGVHYFRNGFLAAADVNITSNLAFRQVFSDSIQLAISPEERSQVFVNKNFGGYSFNFIATTQVISIPTERIRTRQMPGVSFDKRPGLLSWLKGKLPLYFSFESSVAGMSRKETVEDQAALLANGIKNPVITPSIVQRLDFRPEVTLPLNLDGWNLTATAAARGTFYSNSIDPLTRLVLPANVTRVYGEFTLDLRPPALARNFHHGDGSFWFRHVVEPYLTYRRITGVSDFDRVIRFDEVDAVADTNELEYGVTNRFFLRRSTESVNTRPKEKGAEGRRGAGANARPESAGQATGREGAGGKEAGGKDSEKEGEKGAAGRARTRLPKNTRAGSALTALRESQSPLTRQPYEFFSVTLRQKYFFDPTFGGALHPGQRNQFYPINTFSGFTYGGVPRRFSPLNIEARVRKPTTADSELFIDTRTDIDTLGSGGGLRDLAVSFGLRRRAALVRAVEAFQTFYYTRAVTLAPSLRRFSNPLGNEPGTLQGSQWSPSVFIGDRNRGYYGGASFFFDFQNRPGKTSSLVSSVITVGRSWDCCAVTAQYFTFNVGLRHENRVVFSFRLNGIGTFGTEQIGQRFR